MLGPGVTAAPGDGLFSLVELSKSIQNNRSGHRHINKMNITFKRDQKGGINLVFFILKWSRNCQDTGQDGSYTCLTKNQKCAGVTVKAEIPKKDISPWTSCQRQGLNKVPHLLRGFSHHPWLKGKGRQSGRASAAELLTTVQMETVLEWMPPLTLSLERAISSALIEKCLSSRGKSACGRQSVFQEQTSPTSSLAVRASHP